MSERHDTTSRMYVHRRFVVRFLIALLVVLSIASFVGIALGIGVSSEEESQGDSGTPTRLVDTSPFYALLIGSDSLAGTALYTGDISSADAPPQADGILLMRIDPGTCTITLVTVPSNTMLEDSETMLRDTLEASGPQQTVRTVERITGVSIRYYFLMDFSGFVALLDHMDAVTADVPVSITMQDPITAKNITVKAGEGMQLDAAETLAYLRSAEPYAVDSDPHRQLNVRSVVSELVFQVLASNDDAVRKVLGVFEDEVDTNIDNSTLISLVTRFYDNRESVVVYSCTGPYLATTVNTAGEPVISQQVTAWRELMTVVDAGQDPAVAMPQYDFQGSDADYVKEEAPASTATASSSAASGTSSSGKSASAAAAGTSSKAA